MLVCKVPIKYYKISPDCGEGNFQIFEETPNFGLWYPEDTSFDVLGYTYADFAGCIVDIKSASGSCQFHVKYGVVVLKYFELEIN